MYDEDAIREVLEFWFGDAEGDGEVARAQADLWWTHEPANDREVRERFAELAEQAMNGKLNAWTQSPHGRLALVILLDQVPRMAWRGTRKAYSGDPPARVVAAQGLFLGQDRELRPIERVFMYMPFEHSENSIDQDRAVELFRRLADEVPEEWSEEFRSFAEYAERHRDVVARFGRFPHRNEILGRESTTAEQEFLEQPGSSF